MINQARRLNYLSIPSIQNDSVNCYHTKIIQFQNAWKIALCNCFRQLTTIFWFFFLNLVFFVSFLKNLPRINSRVLKMKQKIFN